MINYCQVTLNWTQAGNNGHLLKDRRRTSAAPTKKDVVLCCSRLSALHTEEIVNWLKMDASQTGSQRCRKKNMVFA